MLFMLFMYNISNLQVMKLFIEQKRVINVIRSTDRYLAIIKRLRNVF